MLSLKLAPHCTLCSHGQNRSFIMYLCLLFMGMKVWIRYKVSIDNWGGQVSFWTSCSFLVGSGLVWKGNLFRFFGIYRQFSRWCFLEVIVESQLGQFKFMYILMSYDSSIYKCRGHLWLKVWLNLSHHPFFSSLCIHGDPRARPCRWRGASGGATASDPLQPWRCWRPSQQHRQPRWKQQPQHISARCGKSSWRGGGSFNQRQSSEFHHHNCLSRCSSDCSPCCCSDSSGSSRCHSATIHCCCCSQREAEAHTATAHIDNTCASTSRVPAQSSSCQLSRESGRTTVKLLFGKLTFIIKHLLLTLSSSWQIICLDLSEEMSLSKLESFNG